MLVGIWIWASVTGANKSSAAGIPGVSTTGTIKGYTVDMDTGQPLQAVKVVITKSGAATSSGSAFTDEKGFFEFKGMSSGTYAAEFSLQSYVKETRNWNCTFVKYLVGGIFSCPTRSSDWTVKMFKGGQVSGQLTYQGKPVLSGPGSANYVKFATVSGTPQLPTIAINSKSWLNPTDAKVGTYKILQATLFLGGQATSTVIWASTAPNTITVVASQRTDIPGLNFK